MKASQHRAGSAQAIASGRRAPAGTDLALARLLQLASPALPVGAYSYSQGLDTIVEFIQHQGLMQ
ncbi:MAG: hypothetical protein IH605_07215 [Burkholderiales bacterium]|nr:hypothetical protein [Burkholderiales bacterium]